jgi:hypothetical protein
LRSLPAQVDAHQRPGPTTADHQGKRSGDADSQYTSIALAENPCAGRDRGTISSIGEAYDDALAETTIRLFKTEAVGRRSPFLAGSLRCPSDNGFRVVEYTKWADLCRRSRINGGRLNFH